MCIMTGICWSGRAWITVSKIYQKLITIQLKGCISFVSTSGYDCLAMMFWALGQTTVTPGFPGTWPTKNGSTKRRLNIYHTREKSEIPPDH
jgi:hypothetical protein